MEYLAEFRKTEFPFVAAIPCLMFRIPLFDNGLQNQIEFCNDYVVASLPSEPLVVFKIPKVFKPFLLCIPFSFPSLKLHFQANFSLMNRTVIFKRYKLLQAIGISGGFLATSFI